MKKNIFISAALAVMALSSCQQEKLGGNEAAIGGFRIYAEDTKAVLDGVKVVFQDGDAIDIYADDSETPAVYSYDSSNDLFIPTGTEAEGDTYSVIYPAQDNKTRSIVNIPYRQKAQKVDDILQPYMYMAGVSESNDVYLKHLVGLWEIDLLPSYDGQRISHASLSFTKKHHVNGNFEINWDDYTLTYVDGEDGSRILAGDIKHTMSSTTPLKIYFALPEGTYDGGFKFVADMIDGTKMTKQSSSTITIKRGQITKVKNDVDFVLFDSGAGTESDPYILKTTEHWNNMVTMVDKDAEMYASAWYEVAADIDFEGQSVTPVKSFKGILDGKEHTLKNAKIGDGTASHQAFFYLLNGTVRNLKFDNITVTGGGTTGAASSAAVISAGNSSVAFTIENCHVSNSAVISGDGGSYAAGLVGRCNNASVMIAGCSVSNSVITAGKENVGGLVGNFANGAIENVVSSGNTVAAETGGKSGGVVGNLSGGTLTNAKAIANTVTSGSTNAGGVVGLMGAAHIINIISQNNTVSVATSSCGGVVASCTSNDGKIINVLSEGNTLKSTNHSNTPYFGLIIGHDGSSSYKPFVANTLVLSGTAEYTFVPTAEKPYAGCVGIISGYSSLTLDNNFYNQNYQPKYDAIFNSAATTAGAVTANRFALGQKYNTIGSKSHAGKDETCTPYLETPLKDGTCLSALNAWVDENKATYPSLKSWAARTSGKTFPELILEDTAFPTVNALNVVESEY